MVKYLLILMCISTVGFGKPKTKQVKITFSKKGIQPPIYPSQENKTYLV